MSEAKEIVSEVEVLKAPKPEIPLELIEKLKKSEKKIIDLEEGIDYTENGTKK